MVGIRGREGLMCLLEGGVVVEDVEDVEDVDSVVFFVFLFGWCDGCED